MRDKGLIFGGLCVFLVAVTFPVWYNVAAGTTNKGPEPKLPAAEKECVASVDTMRTSHMDMLIAWRDQVVRQNQRTVTAFNGKTYDMRLTGTCLKCHDNKAEFCDRCHNYAGVQPYCWECHVDPAHLQRTGGG